MNAVKQNLKEDLPALTGVRALAAIWVVLFHFSDLIVSLIPGLSWLLPFFDKGWLGVNVFFVLSGFIITYNYQAYFSDFNFNKYKRFLGLRLARIYPVYIFTLLLMVLMFVAATVLHVDLNKQGDYTISGFLAYIFMIQGWADSGWYPWNGPAWSVSAEWFAYLGFPLVILLLKRIRAIPMVISGILITFVIGFGLQETEILKILTSYDFENILNVSTCFLTGSLASILFQANWLKKANWNVLNPIFFVLFIGMAVFITSWTSFSTIFIPFMILGFAYSKDIIGKCLSSKIMVYLGKISYSVYLLHMIIKFFVLATFMKYFSNGSIPIRIILMLTSLALVIVAASITYHFIEEPMRRKLRNYMEGNTKNKIAVSVAPQAMNSYYTDISNKK